MARMTVLEMTQNILSAMDSDVVDSTEDTEEALQIKTIIVETYNELMSRKEWNHLKLPIPLEELDVSIAVLHPTTLHIPENVTSIEQVRFDTRREVTDPARWTTLRYEDPQTFLDKVLCRASDNSDVDTVEVVGSPAKIMVYNNRQPQFWTSFDDQHITFDAYNADEGTYLAGDRSLVYATILPEFPTDDDSFIPELPARMFPMFLAECKKAAFFYLKETSTPVDEKRAFRGASIYNDNGSKAHARLSRTRYGRPR